MFTILFLGFTTRRNIIKTTTPIGLASVSFPGFALDPLNYYKRYKPYLEEQEEIVTDEIKTTSKFTDVYFYSEVDGSSILKLQKNIKEMSKNEIMKLHIHSNGGSATLGLFSSDLITASDVCIQTFVEGVAASSASLMEVSGQIRFMTKHSLNLMHQPSLDIGSAKYKLVQDEAYNLELITSHIVDVYATHSTMPKSFIEECLYNERYLTAKECLKYNLIDEIL
jgi:ATP-dependent protease ClpP protease subunit